MQTSHGFDHSKKFGRGMCYGLKFKSVKYAPNEQETELNAFAQNELQVSLAMTFIFLLRLNRRR